MRSVAARLHAAAIHLLRYARVGDERTGLTPSRLSALSVVVFGGPRTMGALARAEQVTPATMTGIVAGLEELGLVRKKRDPDDGRSRVVVATEPGRRMLEGARSARIARIAGLLESLPAEELQAAARTARAIETALETAPDREG